jgi:hypothetical protein
LGVLAAGSSAATTGTTEHTLITDYILPPAPLNARPQIPYTMMKFGAFENTVVALYKYVVPKPRDECSKGEQLGVSFAAGYIAGVFCAAISHPADNLVSKLNAQKGSTAGDIIKQVRGCARGRRLVRVGAAVDACVVVVVVWMWVWKRQPQCVCKGG